MTNSTRRTALAMLGLAPAGVAVDAYSFVPPPKSPEDQLLRTGSGAFDKEFFARAFERLAGLIRDDSIAVNELTCTSTLSADKIVDEHDLHLVFHLPPPKA